MRVAILFILFAIPLAADAAIRITEVAWMGSKESANHEWIELHNSGSEIDLTGWSLTDENNLSISLAGSIAAGEYAVLERTSDASAPGQAFLIYTGALSNAGATLSLRNDIGEVLDQVVGGDSWGSIGGDNDTKETAQYGSNGWITAPSTPSYGAAVGLVTKEPLTSSVVTEASENSSSAKNNSTNSTSKAGQGKEKIVLSLPDVTLQLDITAPAFVHVNQLVEFTVKPSGVGDTVADSLQHDWNFGDSSVGQGKEVSHRFTHPGRYVVVVEGGYKRQYQVARFEIDVLPVSIEMVVHQDDSVTVTNSGDSEIDMSSYRLVGKNSFTFPKHTILLPGRSMVLPRGVVGQHATRMMVALYDQSNDMVSAQLPVLNDRVQPVVSDVAPVVSLVSPAPRISALSSRDVIDQSPERNIQNNKFTFATTEAEAGSAVERKPLLGQVAQAAANLSSTSQVAQTAKAAWALPAQWPLFTFLLLLVLGVLSVYFMPAPRRGQD